MEKKNSIPASSVLKENMKDLFTDVPAEGEIIPTGAFSAKKEKSLRSQKKSAKDVQSTSLNKREFVLRFVKKDASLVWPREMKMVNSLFKIFPNDGFWSSLELKFQLNSLCWFFSDEGRKLLNLEYKKFKFEPEKSEVFELENNSIDFKEKKGDAVVSPLTVREFLNLWQKKK